MRLFLVLMVGLLLAACSDSDAPAPPLWPIVAEPSAPTTEPAGAMRYLALGDSYTIGERVEPDERWPVQLAAALRRDGVIPAEPQIIARTGWTTGDLLAAMDRAQLQPRYDLVTVLIGVNNQFRGRDIQQYRREFAEIVRRAIGLAGGRASRVVVLSIPDYGVTPFGGRSGLPVEIAAALDRFNAANRELSRQAGVRYVDITPTSRRAANDPALVAEDGLHPSGKMYALWTTAALPEAMAALGLSAGSKSATQP